MSVVSLEGEAVAVFAAHVVDGVFQTAGLANDRESTVASSYHLCQTARFGLGWHQESISAGIDLASQSRNEAQTQSNTARVFGSNFFEEVFKFALAGTQNDNGNIILHHFFKDVFHQIQTFVACKAGNHTQQHTAVLVFQTHFCAESTFVVLFFLHRDVVVVYIKVFIGGWIVGNSVDTVEDTDHTVALVIDGMIQMVREPWIVDLFGIAWAYGGHDVGFLNGSLHHVHVAVVFQNGTMVVRNTQHIPGDVQAMLTLILDVVDGEHGFDVLIESIVTVEFIQVNRSHCGLPVVAVENINFKVDVFDQFHSSFGVECKTFRIIVVAVETVSLEVVFVVQEVVGHAVIVCGVNTAVLISPSQSHVEIAEEFHFFAPFFFDVAVERQNNAAVMTQSCQSVWQGACYISQTAGCDERSCLGAEI